jgi:hypothetical protein
MLSQVQYILAPGIAALTTVKPGEISESYEEQAFSYVTSLINGWTHESVDDNFKILFDNFYNKDLVDRTKSNFKAMNYFEQIKERKLVSYWKIIPEESEYKWCGAVKISKYHKGVACAVVTGMQTLYQENNEPVGTRKISYLIFGVNVAPNPSTPGRNMFALEVIKVKRGEKEALQRELEKAFKDGVLPPSDENFYVKE